jgi:hypothetical protein
MHESHPVTDTASVASAVNKLDSTSDTQLRHNKDVTGRCH